jgi:hypothetical protein
VIAPAEDTVRWDAGHPRTESDDQADAFFARYDHTAAAATDSAASDPAASDDAEEGR